jgi:excisionase family DNA binding protein
MTSGTSRTTEKRFLTTGDVAALCDVSVGAVKKWIRKGKLDATRTPGGHFRVAADEFERFRAAYRFPRPAAGSPEPASGAADDPATATARLRGEAERARREADVLAELARGINESPDLDALMHRIAGAARELCRADQAHIAIRDPGLEAMEVRYWSGARPNCGQFSIEPGRGVGGQVLLTGRAFRTDNYAEDPRISRDYLVTALAEGVVAGMAVPIRSRDSIEGAIFVANRAARPFTDLDEATLLRLADHAAVALRVAAAPDGARLDDRTQQALADLKAAQEQLVRGETLRALGELAGGAAHHLNNLLAIVWGRVQLLLRREEAGPRRRSLEIVERATKDAADVVRRLQQFARTEPTERVERMDLNELVSEVLEMTRVRWHDVAQAQGVQIDIAFERGEIPLACGDPVALREVIVNIVMNAVDALPQGGRITLASRVDGGMVALSVTDTGVGMSREVLRRAREPFFTTKGVKSTGLGLSVSYGVLERHGGDLAIDSDEGRGTIVTLRLPADRTAPEAATAPAARTGFRPLRILVVDDIAEVREMLAAILAEQGHTVIEAADGPEALATLREGAAVDLVLTDLGMPEMTGWQVAKAIKTSWPHLRIGVVTGWGESPDATPAESKNVDFVLAKPFSAETLQQAIAAL